MTEQACEGGAGGSGNGNERLLRVGGVHVWIKGGVLHLPVEVLHPLLALTSGKPLYVVEGSCGRKFTFMRGADVVAVAPNLGEDAQKVAARFGCSL
jgi:hypothetical protein